MNEFTTIKWGTTIYDDNTILKRIIYNFDTINGLRLAWEKRNRLASCTYEADMDKLTIECREYVDAEEYFTTLEEEE